MDQIIIKALKGDMKSIDVLIQRLQPLLISSIRRYYNNKNEYEDLIQEGNLTILECIKYYDDSKGVHFLGYVQTMIKYLYLNKHKRRIHLSLNQTMGDGELELVDLLRSGEKPILDLLIDEEAGTNLNTALNRLTKRQRDVIILFYYKNQSIGHIANSLGISYRTVVNTKVRALKILRALLTND